MAGIYIKLDFEGETNLYCDHCPLPEWKPNRDGYYCRFVGKIVDWGMSKNIQPPDDCPAQIVPDHGRLMDADLARDSIINKWIDCAVNSFEYKRGLEDACEVIRNTPTIIPADRKEEEA